MHFESPIIDEKTRPLHEYTSCLHIHDKVVEKHIRGAASTLNFGSAIPFTIKVFEKVFLAPDKADIGEKDESDPEVKMVCDQDEENGK